MRRFHSYGPVDADWHFCVPRRYLIDQLLDQLVGDPQKGGHYFTIWAARQTGKTWLMRQAKTEIAQRYGDQFTVFHFSFETMRGVNYVSQGDKGDAIIPPALCDLLALDLPNHPQIETWGDFGRLFSKNTGLWDKPLLLLIDEVDALPPVLLDLLVTQFRKLYLARENNWLHGLALIGVRAVLGVDSKRSFPLGTHSPFNVQRSLKVPNLTLAEVEDLYRQYQRESGQAIAPEVVGKIYEVTRGQPGLVSWFGELFIPHRRGVNRDQTIDWETWRFVETFRVFKTLKV